MRLDLNQLNINISCVRAEKLAEYRIILFIFLSIMALLISSNFVNAQVYDLLIKGGHVIDPKNNIDTVIDLAIKDGKVAKVDYDIAETSATRVINAKSLIVIPGIIDIHTHNFFGTEPDAYISNSFTSVAPDEFTFRAGVTTVVDAGSSGWRNFEIFKAQTIDRSKTRVLAFLNIVGSGMKGGPIEQNLEDMNAELTSDMAKKYPGLIVGIKVAHFNGPEWDPVDRAVKAGKIAGIPVMIDFGGHIPRLSLDTLLMEKLRPGDIFTHTFAHVKSRIPIVDEQMIVRPYVWEAQKRGIVFDVGHGGGSFLFRQAIPALEQGFKPNSISTDLHTGSMNGGMKDMLNVMSKFLNIGLTLRELIECSTWNPARYVKREDLGNLSLGAVADIAVIRLKTGEFGYVDTGGFKINGNQKLECELTIREGNIVWDLNGISSPDWHESILKDN